MYFLSLVLLFLIRLRFPRNKSIVSVLTDRYGRPVLALYRSLERQDFKVRKGECDLHFLKCCQAQNLIPNFLKFKLPNRNLQHTRSYRNCQRDLLSCEIRNKTRALKNVVTRREQLSTQLRSTVSFLDFNHLVNLIENTNCKTIGRCEFVQNRKLRDLGYVNEYNIPTDNVIFNFSDVILTEEEKKALSRGLRFVFPPRRLNFVNYFLEFEKLFNNISLMSFYDPLNKGFQFFKRSLSHLAHSCFYSFNPFTNNQFLDKDVFNLLKSLSSKENLIICRPDKGNGIVLLNKSDYVEKMNNILHDRAKFVPVTSDPYAYILKHEDKVNRVLRKFKTDGTIGESTFHSLYSSGSKPGVMYGLPKVHKPECPLRPILSAIGTHNYNLAKFLVPLLTPITMSEFCVKDSFSFAKELADLSFIDCIMASFDVKSLFTNIPLTETIEISVNNMYPNDDDIISGFNKKQMKSLLSLAANDCMFLFNDKFYVQSDGCAMGSPIGPTLANIFLSHYEKIWLQDCPNEFKPLLYRRYVDDTFLLFKNEAHIPLFLEYLNSKHPNIEFTSDTENENKLPFLDIEINRTVSGFQTSIYRKPTFTGLCTKFTSFIPLQYKRNLVSTLAYRAYQICSNYVNFHKEVSFLRKLLFNNGFPYNFTDVYIGKMLNTIFRCNNQEKTTVEKKFIYFSIPFMGSHSYTLRKRLKKLFYEFYPQVCIRVVFKSLNPISRFFNIKDKVPDDLKSCVVYKYECDCCSATYVGKCSRHFKTRINEHLGRSPRTGNLLVKPSYSAIREHCEGKDHRPSKENFSILVSANSSVDLNIMEALYQHMHKPTLGRSSYDLFCF